MKTKIFKILDDLKIDYKNYEHEAVFTCDDCKWIELPWKRLKSLLLRNKKATNFYMIVLWDDKQLDTNLIRDRFEDTKMSFASPERMMEKIWLKPGSVSPFALINNLEKDIRVVFDKDLEGELIWFHPLQNDNTVVLKIEWVEIFLNELWFNHYYLNL